MGVNFSLSHFAMNETSHFAMNETMECQYQGHRSGPSEDPKYAATIDTYLIWVLRLLFIVIFENVIAVTVTVLKLIIPDIPASLKHRIRASICDDEGDHGEGKGERIRNCKSKRVKVEGSQ